MIASWKQQQHIFADWLASCMMRVARRNHDRLLSYAEICCCMLGSQGTEEKVGCMPKPHPRGPDVCLNPTLEVLMCS